jgi:hypothetical protein
VLFLIFGSAGAGKTVVVRELRGAVPSLAVHDFDEIGVPFRPDTAWRHRGNEEWVRRALEYQAEGTDLLLAGQTPFGELLAAPSVPRLEAVSACLLDCSDETRMARLRARGPEWLARAAGELHDYFNWAAWMRGHAADPAWRPEVIRNEAKDGELNWARWSGWKAGDARWRVAVLDTSALSIDHVVAQLAEWVASERTLVRSGAHPLLAGWA